MFETLGALFGMFANYNVPGILLIATISVVTGGAVLTLTRKIRINKLIKDYAEVEAKIRQISLDKVRTKSLEKLLVKHEKMRLKAAKKRINLKMENLSGNLIYNNSRISKTAAYQIKNEAKLNILKMKDYQKGSLRDKINLGKIAKLETKVAQTSKIHNLLPRVTETVRFDDAVTTLTSNHIATHDESLRRDYEKALNAPKGYYPVRKEKRKSFPMFLEVRDEKGELVYSLSDVSPIRFQKFANDVFASVYTQMPHSGMEERKYTIQAFDSYKKRGDKNLTFFEYIVYNKEDVYDARDSFNEYAENHFKISEDSITRVPESEFTKATQLAEFETKTRQLKGENKFGQIIFNKEGSVLNSELLQVIHERTKQKIDFGQRYSYPIETKLTINGDLMLTAIDDTTDVYYAMKDYYDAYAFVLAVQREVNELIPQVNISTTSIIEKPDVRYARAGSITPQRVKALETVPSTNYGYPYEIFKRFRGNTKFINALALMAREFNLELTSEFFEEIGIKLKPEELKNLKDKKWDVVYSELLGVMPAKAVRTVNKQRTAATTARAAKTATRSVTGRNQIGKNQIKTTLPRVKREFAEDLERFKDLNGKNAFALDVEVGSEGKSNKFVINLSVRTENQKIYHKYYLTLLTEAYVLVANKEIGARVPKIEFNFNWGTGKDNSSTKVFDNLPELERYIMDYADKNFPGFNFNQVKEILDIDYKNGDRTQE
ncbi:MAG: hypothetical protein ACOX6H_03760 [Christensenellales bacterium]|jgi:hypothetical protein